MGKRLSLCRYFWQFSLPKGLLLLTLIAAFSLSFVVTPRTFAVPQPPCGRRNFTLSPNQGPVGTVITVNGTNLTCPDGTQISLGYTTDFSHCIVPTDSQEGTVQKQNFSGWLHWPTSTGTGSFGVCVVSASTSSLIGNFNVLSATPPQITVAPTVPNAGKQATVIGTHFLPAGITVNLVWQSANTAQTIALGSVSPDGTGTFSQTFTVPSNSSTGSYSVTAASGTSQPPTLSASTTFRINGLTITPVPTATAPNLNPTATPALSPTYVTLNKPTSNSTSISNANNTSLTINNKSSLLIPIILGGLLLIVATLTAGVLLVRKQRSLTATSQANKATSPVGPDPLSMQETTVHNPDNRPHRLTAAKTPKHTDTLPFDPDLADAMRQAQVSMFAMPKPPMSTEVLSSQ